MFSNEDILIFVGSTDNENTAVAHMMNISPPSYVKIMYDGMIHLAESHVTRSFNDVCLMSNGNIVCIGECTIDGDTTSMIVMFDSVGYTVQIGSPTDYTLHSIERHSTDMFICEASDTSTCSNVIFNNTLDIEYITDVVDIVIDDVPIPQHDDDSNVVIRFIVCTSLIISAALVYYISRSVT